MFPSAAIAISVLCKTLFFSLNTQNIISYMAESEIPGANLVSIHILFLFLVSNGHSRTEYKAPDIYAEEENVKLFSVTSTQGPGEGMYLLSLLPQANLIPAFLFVCYLHMQSFPVWAKVCPSPEAPPLANRCCYACEYNTSQSQEGSSATGRVVQRKRASEECSWGQACSCPDFWFCFPPLTWREKANAHRYSEPWGQSFTRGQVGQ